MEFDDLKARQTYGFDEQCMEIPDGEPTVITCNADGSDKRERCAKGDIFCADNSPQFCKVTVANQEYCNQLPMIGETYGFNDATCRC